MLAFAGSIFAQSATQSIHDGSKHKRHLSIQYAEEHITPTFNQGINPARSTSLFESDFSDPGVWMMVDQSMPYPLGWQIINTPDVSPISALNPLELPGAANGFAMVLGDTASAGEDSFQDASIRTVSPMNLSGESNLIISFLQVSRNYLTTYYFEYSLNGTVWTRVPINTTLSEDASTANPEQVTFNVSEYIAGQPTVYIGFGYEANWGWFWAIDDVVLSPPLENDLSLTAAYRNNWSIAYEEGIANAAPPVSATTFAAAVNDLEMVRGFEYGLIPKDQMSLHVVGYVINNGADTQTGVTLTANLFSPTGNLYSFSSPGDVSLAPLEEVQIDFEIDIEAELGGDFSNGLYAVNYAVSADEEDDNPSNNTVAGKLFRINQDLYSHDIGAPTVTGWFTNIHNTILANRIAFQDSAAITHIQFVILPNQTVLPNLTLALQNMVGKSVYPNVRRASVLKAESPTNPGTAIFGLTDLQFVIDEASVTVNNSQPIYINYALHQPIGIDLNEVYHAELFVPELPEGELPYVFIPGRFDLNPYASMMRIFGDESLIGQGWYTVEASPMVRFIVGDQALNTSPAVQMLDFEMGQNYPNPVNGFTMVDWELIKPANNVQFSVSDNTGRTVFTKDLGDRPAGKQEPITFDMSRYAAGVYQYGITIGNQRIVRKLMVAK